MRRICLKNKNDVVEFTGSSVHPSKVSWCFLRPLTSVLVLRDDDDINDVASMAGVNLNEENARILATSSELVGTKIRSCKDESFLPAGLLHRRILDTGTATNQPAANQTGSTSSSADCCPDLCLPFSASSFIFCWYLIILRWNVLAHFETNSSLEV